MKFIRKHFLIVAGLCGILNSHSAHAAESDLDKACEYVSKGTGTSLTYRELAKNATIYYTPKTFEEHKYVGLLLKFIRGDNDTPSKLDDTQYHYLISIKDNIQETYIHAYQSGLISSGYRVVDRYTAPNSHNADLSSYTPNNFFAFNVTYAFQCVHQPIYSASERFKNQFLPPR